MKTLAEAALAAGVSERSIQGLVDMGALVPTVRGEKGRGNCHRFSEYKVGLLKDFIKLRNRLAVARKLMRSDDSLMLAEQR